MNIFNTDTDDDRGQVGIGTLIIFIALVLVAAVAAGVLVNTAGLLQSQAEETGQDAQSQVGNQIDVVSATGTVDDTDELVQNTELVVKKSAGSDPIDLEEATIQYTSSSASETLQSGGGAGDFDTTSISGESETVLTNTGDRIEISFDISEFDGDGLDEGESATLRIVDQSGATTTYVLNPPQTFGERSVVDL